ncbi:MAG: MgtC/SapB family protein [Bdellovibrionales bacterium]|nr:MgtC/SapB family protein [Bdellovibrionales bacterium]
MEIVIEFLKYVIGSIQQLYAGDAGLVLIAALLGSLVGLERELAGKDPSLRTFSLICLGSCLFAVVSRESIVGVVGGDPSRIAAQVVTGIGFLGAGTIFRSKFGISGLTTAALMWVTSAIGVAVGFGHVRLAVAATLTALIIIYILQFIHKFLRFLRPNLYKGENTYE